MDATLVPSKAKRFVALAESRKGQAKLIDALAHQFGDAIKPEAVVADVSPRMRKAACYGFHADLRFGECFSSLDEAVDALAVEDGWLIVLADGSAGMYRPEADWDGTCVIAASAA